MHGVERVYVNRDYIHSIMQAGGIPLLLPLLTEHSMICRFVDMVDAVVFSGGQDVHPQHYNAEPAPHLGQTCEERDIYDMALLRQAHAQKKPIFGICRGLQLINVAFGGSLYQDIGVDFDGTSLQHEQKEERHTAAHTVTIDPNSWLYSVFGKNTLDTNSVHHQAIDQLAPGFQVTARAEDGIIEAIEKENIHHHFVVGVQWHPEMMAHINKDMETLFRAFINRI